jgi:hypothetical protein
MKSEGHDYCSFDNQGAVPCGFVSEGKTVNQYYYFDALQCLRENV